MDVSGRTRHGFWGSLGLGAGAEAVDLVNPDDGFGYSDNLTKPTVQLRLGGTVSPNLRLGGELSSWINSYYGSGGDVTETVGGVFGIAQYYPAKRAGFYLKGGLGLGRSAVDYAGGPTISDYGFAAVVGAGYDIRVYDVATGTTRTITDGIGSNESPAFSPNGRHIAFTSTRAGKAQIFLIDRDGKNLQQITRTGMNRYPNWSQ